MGPAIFTFLVSFQKVLRLLVCARHCYSKGVSWTGTISMTWEHFRNAYPKNKRKKKKKKKKEMPNLGLHPRIIESESGLGQHSQAICMYIIV